MRKLKFLLALLIESAVTYLATFGGDAGFVSVAWIVFPFLALGYATTFAAALSGDEDVDEALRTRAAELYVPLGLGRFRTGLASALRYLMAGTFAYFGHVTLAVVVLIVLISAAGVDRKCLVYARKAQAYVDSGVSPL